MRTRVSKPFIVSAALLFSGCIGAGGFQSRLTRDSYELMYIHEARTTERQPGTMSLGAFTVEHELPPATTVQSAGGGYFVPLLFVNVWGGKYQATLGADQIDNDYVQFMKGSLIEELRRNAIFTVSEHDGDVQLDVKVTNIEMNAPIVESGYVIVLGYGGAGGRTVTAGPVEVAITGELVMRRRGQEVLRKTVNGGSRNGALPERNRTIDRLMIDFGAAMVEGMSFAVKNFNESVVREVNSAIAELNGDDRVKLVAGGDDPEKPAPVPAKVQASISGAGNAGAKLTRPSSKQIDESVSLHSASLRKCVDRYKESNPGSSGVLELRWIIEADGSVWDVAVLGEFAGTPLSGCVVEVVKRVQFPRSSEEQAVTFQFEF